MVAVVVDVGPAGAGKLPYHLTGGEWSGARAGDHRRSAAAAFRAVHFGALVDPLAARPTGAGRRPGVDVIAGVGLRRPGGMADAVQRMVVQEGHGRAVPPQEDRAARRGLVQLEEGEIAHGPRRLDGRTQALDAARLGLRRTVGLAARQGELEVSLQVCRHGIGAQAMVRSEEVRDLGGGHRVVQQTPGAGEDELPFDPLHESYRALGGISGRAGGTGSVPDARDVEAAERLFLDSQVPCELRADVSDVGNGERYPLEVGGTGRPVVAQQDDALRAENRVRPELAAAVGPLPRIRAEGLPLRTEEEEIGSAGKIDSPEVDAQRARAGG